MDVSGLLKRAVPDRFRSNDEPNRVEAANDAWRAAKRRSDDADDAYEALLELLAEYDERPTSEREREIERTLREVRDAWADVERRAAEATEYDHELERIEEMAREQRTEFEDHRRAFEDDPEAFLEERYFDPAELVGDSLEDGG